VSQIRAVFFDLDDTLCDTIGTREPRARLAFQRLAPACPGLDEEDFVARVMAPVAGDRAVRGLRAVIEEIGLAGGELFRQALDIWFFVGCDGLLQPFPGVQETVASLSRGHVLGVITNGDEGLQRSKLSQIGVDARIEYFIASGSAGCEKPDPRIFRHACSLAGVAPGETVFVGDRVDVDVTGAKAAGMRSVWFNHWGGHLDGADGVRPDATVERIVELPDVIATLESAP